MYRRDDDVGAKTESLAETVNVVVNSRLSTWFDYECPRRLVEHTSEWIWTGVSWLDSKGSDGRAEESFDGVMDPAALLGSSGK